MLVLIKNIVNIWWFKDEHVNNVHSIMNIAYNCHKVPCLLLLIWKKVLNLPRLVQLCQEGKDREKWEKENLLKLF